MGKGAQKVLAVSLCALLAACTLRAQPPERRRMADSLTKEWELLWRRSDSLRVEAMFLRMRADSVRRADTSTPSAAPEAAPMPIDSAILRRVREGRTPKGVTLSDTLTARRLSEEGESGVASYYAEKFHGRKTSSGERYDMHDHTCAHRWLPFGTKLRVTNVQNNRSVVVRVNDRGPWKHGRIIDVSKAAAIELDMIRAGTATVRVEIEPDEPAATD